jgi:hypothetical protein
MSQYYTEVYSGRDSEIADGISKAALADLAGAGVGA